MNTLRDELNSIICSEEIKGINFVRLNQWQWILEKIANTFLSHGKLSIKRVWLWDSLKEPYESYQPDDALSELGGLLNASESYWFIASDEAGKYWVLEGTGSAVITLLEKSRCFEYYVTNKEISWLICENHHNVMIIKGSFEPQAAPFFK